MNLLYCILNIGTLSLNRKQQNTLFGFGQSLTESSVPGPPIVSEQSFGAAFSGALAA